MVSSLSISAQTPAAIWSASGCTSIKEAAAPRAVPRYRVIGTAAATLLSNGSAADQAKKRGGEKEVISAFPSCAQGMKAMVIVGVVSELVIDTSNGRQHVAILD